MNMNPVNWNAVETVLLDMDGTVLDLYFDDCFWNRHLPMRYAEHHGLALAQARRELAPIFKDNAGQLSWYSTDFWGRSTGLDVIALMRELTRLIDPLPGALACIDAVRKRGCAVWLVTNAHPDTVRIKLDKTGIESRFDRVITSHEFGCAKEEPGFWPALLARYPFSPPRSLFVDDNPAVVAAAAAWGIGQVIALSQPDSRGGLRQHNHQPSVARLADLAPE